MASRIFALIIWAAVAASLAYWGLRWLARPTGVPTNATPVSMDSGTQGDLRRLLTGPAKASGPQVDTSAASALASRMKLLGVVAPRQETDHNGVALISIDGKPPKAIRVGGVIEGDTVLQSLTQRGASIGPAGGPAAATLDLPLLPPPATGSLPPPEGVSTTPPQSMNTPPGAIGSLAAPEAGGPGMQPPPPGGVPGGMPQRAMRGSGNGGRI
jgi:general secretion pathway protein C